MAQRGKSLGVNGCRSGWNRRIFYAGGGGGWISAVHEPNASGRQREEVVRKGECQPFAYLSVKVQPLSRCSTLPGANHLPCFCMLGMHCRFCVQLSVSWGIRMKVRVTTCTPHMSAPELGWQSWQHWRKTASGIEIPALFWIWGHA